MPSPRLSNMLLAVQESRDVIGNVPITANSKINQANDLITTASVLEVKGNGQLLVDANGPRLVSPITDEIYKAGNTAYVTVNDSVQIAHGAVK